MKKAFVRQKKCFEIFSFLHFVHIGIIFKLFYYLYYMAYMTKIDIFVYEYDPLTIRVCERGPHVRGYYVHKEYDMSVKLNIWPIFMKITHDNWR